MSPSSTDTDKHPSAWKSWLPVSWSKELVPAADPNDAPSTRWNISAPPRLLSLAPAAFLITASLGFIRSARASSLRYLAENAHRPPRTKQGWYFYQKTKNYRVLLAGIKGAAKDGARGFGVGATWVFVEHYWEKMGEVEYKWVAETAKSTNELAAGVTTSALVSVLYKLGWRTGLRTVGLGAIMGGTLQIGQSVSNAIRKVEEERKAEEAEKLAQKDSATQEKAVV
ncbi:hypothetical protein CYLTODRAFT_424353 [Cylindrobasidium torrendii FP15055 ss-10]|uniref:Uncharacterized protein n=1 Tax=Cylindrobasidium torrendii FP15055 ss-10 TaxID=1314674 RepID=A0A0D7B7E0_9AGAR|nr:hypothetical protein CYLTODRAFT_424353 [Cylindrobasidium torrendii FP15055 ss-10]